MIGRLLGLVENEPDESLRAPFGDRIAQLQGKMNTLNAKIRDAESRQRKPPQPLSIARAKKYLAECRETLNLEIPQAAEAIRELTGPIKIRHERIPGRTVGSVWIATFSPDLLRLLRHVAKEPLLSLPTAAEASLALPEVEVRIERVPQYVAMATLFKELHDKGASIQSIAQAYKTNWGPVAAAIEFAKTGARPKLPSKKKKRGNAGRAQTVKYKEIAAEVVRLRDQEKISFRRMAKQFGVKESTVHRAHDYARPEAVRAAAELGKSPSRGHYSHLGEEVYVKIRELLRAGGKPNDVARQAGCGESTVRRVMVAMENDEGGRGAA